MNVMPPETRTKHTVRVEDDVLVRGLGRFVDDVHAADETHAAFVRSPHAFARIRSIDVGPALAAPGVLAVLTAQYMDAAGVRTMGGHPPLSGRGGTKLFIPHRPSLAGDRVLHIGQAVAMVVAATRREALEAAELVAVDYEELAPLVDALDALRPGAPQIWPEAPGNVALDWAGPVEDAEGNAREVERLFQSAKHIAKVELINQRINVASMETRGATGAYDVASDTYTLRACSQGTGPLRDNVAAAMGIEPKHVRVLTDDVGGAFGLKTSNYPEYPALLVAARKLGRPVHWMSTRSESFLSDNQARDTYTTAELALDGRGRFLALRIRNVTNLGAYIGAVGAQLATINFARNLPTVYDIRHIDISVRCVFTNTLPTAPYRGAGRPEANYTVERLVDAAARMSGIDRVELRRRNLIPVSTFPYRSPMGVTFDSGEFATILDKALALADYAGFKERRRLAKKRGHYRGLGISCFLEHAGGAPTEGARLIFPGGDSLVIALNVQSTGQSHATVFPHLVAERLGLSPQLVTHRHGDTALGIKGYASVGSRSAMAAGHATVRGIETMLKKARPIAATLLEAADSDIEYRNGAFQVVGTDRRVSLFAVAARATEMKARGEILEDLDTNETTDTPLTFPNGCHIAEVEIDPDTGAVSVLSYACVDDSGNVLDHTVVQGQVQGGLAQGLGQVLLENTAYDRGNGQLVSASFMDYAMPRAENMPPIKDALHSVPAKTNPLGVKGVGEAGTTGSLAAIMNAIADAIPNGAGADLNMPATAPKVWEACRKARAGKTPST
jgi:aerobic carbon-monoxide dehydrogenase large subunit